MFGLNIFENRKPPAEKSPSEKPPQENVSENYAEHAFHDLNEFLGIEKVSNTIQLNDLGINTDIQNILPEETLPEPTPISPENQETSQEMPEEKGVLFEIIPEENTPLIEYIENTYKESSFATTTAKVLDRHNFSNEEKEERFAQILQKNAQKTLAAFKGIAKQELLESGPADLDVDNYISWRLSAFTENVRYVLEFSGDTGVLSAENFYSPELFELFTAEQTAYDIKSSDDIETLYEKINNDA